MPHTVTNAAARTPVNSVDDRFDHIQKRSAKAGIGVNSVTASPAFLDHVRQAMADKGLTQKAMAINAGVAPSAVSDALNDVGGRSFSCEWFWAQPDDFVLYTLELLMAARGFNDLGIRAAKIARIKELIGLILEVA